MKCPHDHWLMTTIFDTNDKPYTRWVCVMCLEVRIGSVHSNKVPDDKPDEPAPCGGDE